MAYRVAALNADLAKVCALIGSTILLDCLAISAQTISSELIAWIIIFASCIAVSYLDSSSFPSIKSLLFLSRPLLLSLSGILLLCLSHQFGHVIWWTAPVLIPLQAILSTLGRSEDEFATKSVRFSAVWFIHNRKSLLSTLFCILVCGVLWSQQILVDYHLNLCYLVAYTLVLLSQRLKQETTDEALQTSSPSTITYFTALSICLITSLTPIALIWPFMSTHVAPSNGYVNLIYIGCLKSLYWFTLISLARQSAAPIISWSITFSLLSGAVSFNNLYPLPLAFTSLAQIPQELSTSRPSHKWSIAVFGLWPLFTLISGSQSFWLGSQSSYLLFSKTVQPDIHASWSTLGNFDHPIAVLAEKAQARFQALLHKQSTSLETTIMEYKRRYGRCPPPGFDRWYNFTVMSDGIFIDEYDLLTRAFDPFLEVKPSILREYVSTVEQMSRPDVAILVISNHSLTATNLGFHHAQLESLLQPILHLLPDMLIPLNNQDEARVILPYGQQAHSRSLTSPESIKSQVRPLTVHDTWRMNMWEICTLPCGPDTPARAVEGAMPSDLYFISDIAQEQDICNWPSQLSSQHGILSSSTIPFIHNFLPMFSTSKVSSYSDLLFPSSYYFQEDIAEYNEEWDRPWEDKADTIYWRGSASGGHWHDGSWKNGHRQRFIAYLESNENVQVLHQSSDTHEWSERTVEMNEVRDLFNCSMTAFFQCDEEDCQAQADFFHTKPKDTLKDSYSSKLLYNLDGNSFSGRYYRFLKSNSLVVMEHLLKEWHDDRLFPWVHYVPITLGLQELPETSRYLLQDPEGQVLARRMAMDSRDWSRKTLRPEDLTSAYFRAFLEFARLLREDRDSLTC